MINTSSPITLHPCNAVMLSSFELMGVISFGLAVLFGVGLFLAIYAQSGVHGDPLFWAPFVGVFLIATYRLLRRPLY
jgi:hypothetical protein